MVCSEVLTKRKIKGIFGPKKTRTQTPRESRKANIVSQKLFRLFQKRYQKISKFNICSILNLPQIIMIISNDNMLSCKFRNYMRIKSTKTN